MYYVLPNGDGKYSVSEKETKPEFFISEYDNYIDAAVKAKELETGVTLQKYIYSKNHISDNLIDPPVLYKIKGYNF